MFFVREPNFINDPSELGANKAALLNEGTQFLVDYQFRNQNLDGLSIITSYGIESRAILVTNHFHDPVILDRAVKVGVKVLAKEFIEEASFDIKVDWPDA